MKPRRLMSIRQLENPNIEVQQVPKILKVLLLKVLKWLKKDIKVV